MNKYFKKQGKTRKTDKNIFSVYAGTKRFLSVFLVFYLFSKIEYHSSARSNALQMLIFIAVGFLDEPSVTLRDAERQIRPSGEICGIFMSKEFRKGGGVGADPVPVPTLLSPCAAFPKFLRHIYPKTKRFLSVFLVFICFPKYLY